MGGKRGRGGKPSKPGSNPAGAPRDTVAKPLSATEYQRIKELGHRIGADPRLSTEVGRLHWEGKLTATQVAAANRIAHVYGRYERLWGLHRNARSPSYERGFAEAPGLDIDRLRELNPAAAAEIEDQQRQARATFLALQDQIPRPLRDPVEQLCVSNGHILPTYLAELRDLLDRLAMFFRIAAAKKSGARPQLRQAPSPDQKPLPRPDYDRICWTKTLRKLLPRGSEDEFNQIIDTQRALLERERFRQEKLKGGR